MSETIFSVWEGVYTTFADAGGGMDAFKSNIWIDKQKDKLNEALLEGGLNSFQSKDYPLPLVVGMALSQKSKLNVLDFGGGMGLHYLEMITKVPDSQFNVEYYIVDNEETINSRPTEIEKFKHLHFSSNLDDVNTNMDILHIGSTLQYIEDWQGLLQLLCEKYKPKYFILSDVHSGDVPTFVSHQIFYNEKIPHVFINISELYAQMIDSLGFKLLFKTKFVRTILNQDKVFPNHALPDNYRIDRPYNLVFVK